MVNISSQLVSLLKDLQNTQASAVLALTDETGLPEGVSPGDELKATVVGKLSDLYLMQVDNRLIRARTQLPLQMGDSLRLRVVDNNTPATVRILERLTQQPQPATGSEARTFMAMKSALFHVLPQIESLLEKIPTSSGLFSNLPEEIKSAVSTLNALTQGDTAQPDKIRALFSLFAFDAPDTLASSTASNSTIFMEMLQEGLNAIQEQLPLSETSFASPFITTQSGMVNHSDSLQPNIPQPNISQSNSPQPAQLQGSPAFDKSGVIQTQSASAGSVQPPIEAVPSQLAGEAAVKMDLTASSKQPVQWESSVRPANPVALDPVVSGPALTSVQAEPKDVGSAVRPVWLYEPAASMQRTESQQVALSQARPQDVPVAFQNQQKNTPQVSATLSGAQQFAGQELNQAATQTSVRGAIQTQEQVQGQVQGQVQVQGQGQAQAPQTPVTPTSSSSSTQMTTQVGMQAADTTNHSRNTQETQVRQAMGVFLNQAAEEAKTAPQETASVQQPPSFKDMQKVQYEMRGQVQEQLKAVSSNTANVAQEGMTGVRLKQAATIADEQASSGAAQPMAHTQETDVRTVLNSMDTLARHMDKMQTFRLELQQQTGVNFWLVPLWFNGDSGSGHMIWWRDQKDEQKNGASKDSRGYNLLFDLQLSRLGSLKIRLSCSGKTVQCSVAAQKEVLPVIRGGIEELRARLNGIGFSLQLAELSTLQGLESTVFDSLGGVLTSASGVLNIVA